MEKELGVDFAQFLVVCECQEVTPASEEVSVRFTVTEAERVAEDPECESPKDDINRVLDHDVDLILGTDRSALQ